MQIEGVESTVPIYRKITNGVFMLRIFLILILSLFFCSSPSIAETVARWPETCHALSHTEILTRSDAPVQDSWRIEKYRNAFDSRKFDVVCFGKDLTIDSAIRTNGGDLIIYADSLIIRAPIDTRVYRPSSTDANFVDPTEGAPFPKGPAATNYFNTWQLIESGGYPNDKKIAEAYATYYDCGKECIQVSTQKYTSRLPDGLTLPMVNLPVSAGWARDAGVTKRDGLPPPDEVTDFAHYRSGDVFIFARKVFLPEDIPGAGIITAGSEGGIGGAGETYNCIGGRHEQSGFSCLDYTSASLNAPGGRGGDGGNVTVLVEDSIAGKEFTNRIKSGTPTISFQGGAPGPSTKLRSPTYRGDPAQLQLVLFQPEGTWPEASRGQAGTLQAFVVGKEELFERFYQTVRAKDSLPIFDVQEVAARVKNDPSKDFLSFDDYIAKRLIERTVTRLESVVEDAQRLFVSPDFKVGLNVGTSEICESPKSALRMTEQVATAALQLSETCMIETSPFRLFIEKKGGLLNVTDNRALAAFHEAMANYNAAEEQESWHKILSTLLVSQSILMRNFGAQEKARYDEKIARVRSAISTLQTTMQAAEANNSPDFMAISLKLVKAYSSVAGFAESVVEIYDQTQADKDPTSAQLNRFAKSASDIGRANAELNALPGSYAKSITDSQEQIFRMQEAVKTLQSAQADLVNEMALGSRAAMQSASYELAQALESRAKYGRRVRNRLVYFDDFLKLSVVSYYLDPSRSASTLASNLNNLKIFLTGFPAYDPVLSFRDYSPVCGAGIIKESCISIARQARPVVLAAGLQTPTRRNVDTVIYIVAANSGPFRLNTISLKARTRK
jgi:hypothetical protein